MSATSVTGISGPGIAFPGNKLANLIYLIREESVRVTNFLVGNDGNDEFTSIQAAINAAVSKGHNSSNPAVILVKPGTYKEDLTLASGVDIKAVAYGSISLSTGFNGFPSTTLVEGSITVNLTDSGRPCVNWLGIDITSPTIGIRFTGSNSQSLVVRDATIISATETIYSDNTASNNSIYLKYVFATNPGTLPVIHNDAVLGSDFNMIFEEMKIGAFASGSDNIVINHQSGAVYSFSQVQCGGQIVVGPGSMGFVINGSILTNLVPGIIMLAPIGFVLVANALFASTAPFIVQGTGTFIYANVLQFPGATGTFDPGLTIINAPMVFTPAQPTDWTPTPTTIQEALNQCAARLTAGGL